MKHAEIIDHVIRATLLMRPENNREPAGEIGSRDAFCTPLQYPMMFRPPHIAVVGRAVPSVLLRC